MKKFLLFVVSLFPFTFLVAQFTHQVGNGGNAISLPYNNQYDFNWCSVIYPQDQINISGDITKISYRLTTNYPGSEIAYSQEVYLAHTTDIEFTDAGYPDTASMTLVYNGQVQYLDFRMENGMTEIELTTPFKYNNQDNLLVHIENHDGTKFANPDFYFINYSTTTTVYPCKYNNQDGTFPETAGTLTHEIPNIYLTFDSGLDAGISAINGSNDFLLPGLQDVNVNIRNYMGDLITEAYIEWEVNGMPQSTYHWTGSVNPGQESDAITIAPDFDFHPGTFVIKAWTTQPNLGVDELSLNDTLTQVIHVADYIEIADASYSGNNTSYIPFYTRSFQGWAGTILHKDSLPDQSKICGIAYDVESNGYELNNQSVYFSHFADPFFTDGSMPEEEEMVPMFSGSIDFTSNGWNKIAFDTMFAMSDTQNALIYTTQKSGAFHSSPTAYRPSVYGGNVGVYGYNDSGNEFPTGNGTLTARIPNMRLYLLIPADAGITSLEAPATFCNTGSNAISVTLKNYGADTLTSAVVKYQLDEGAVQSVNWTGQIPSYHTRQLDAIGDINLSYGEHTLKIWTELPNESNDYKPGNDTIIRTIHATNSLCGTYVIGETPSDYLTLREAFDSLYSAGISCDVVFEIKPGIYNAQYLLTEFSAVNDHTVTLQPQTGDSTDVILTTDSTDYLVNLQGTRNIKFKGLTFTSDNAEVLFQISNRACNVQLEGNYFAGTTTTGYSVYSPQEANSVDTSIAIANNLFHGAAVAISLSSDGSEYERYNRIVSNQFIDQTEISIDLQKQSEYVISNNQIENSTGKCSYVAASQKGRFMNNRIRIGEEYQETVRFQGNADTTIIANNFIQGEKLTMGAVNLSADNLLFVFNTVVSNNNALTIYGSNNVVQNNILISKPTGTAITVGAFASNNISDFNCLYSGEENPLGMWNDVAYNTLEEWQSASGLDANSLSVWPGFHSATDLHTHSLFLDGKGTPISEVSDDIDSEPRDPSNPDIGADEFTGKFSLEEDLTLCLEAAYEIHAGEGYDSYLWSTGADSSYIVVDSTGIGHGSETYSVTVILDGISYTDSVEVAFSSPLATLPSYYCAVAESDSVYLTAADGVSYEWSTGDSTQSIWLSAGDASVIVTDANGCQTTDHITREWNRCPANLNMPADTTIYPGETLTLDANTVSCGAEYSIYSYEWNTGDTTETITIDANSLGIGTYDYSISITNEATVSGCQTSDQVSVIVESSPSTIEKTEISNISLSPNPTSGIVSIKCNHELKAAKIMLINLKGQIVFSEYHENLLNTTLDLSELDNGVYILSLEDMNMKLTHRIVRY